MTEAYNIDCMEAMAQMKDNEFDLAIVDPPYGIGIDNTGSVGGTNRKHPAKIYKQAKWDNEIPSESYFLELDRVSIKAIVWGANNFNLKSNGWIVWDKLTTGNFSDCELAYTNFLGSVRKFTYRWNGMIQGDKCQTIETRIHPTQKPVALYKWLLKNYAKEGDRILDTHLGSGSFRIAAYDMGFDFVGYEIDKDYFDAQEKRFANHIRQGNLFQPNEMY